MAFSYKKQTHKSKGKAGRIPHPVGASPHSGARKNKLTAAFKAREDKVRPPKKKAPKAIPTIKPRSGPTKRRPTMKEQLKDSGVAIDYDQLDKMKYGGKITKKSHGGRINPVTGKADGPYKVLPSEEVPIMPKPKKPKKKIKSKKPSKPESLLPKKMGGGKVLYKKQGGKVNKEATSGDDLISSCYD